MATDSTISAEDLFLMCGRFGLTNDHEVPPGGFTGALHHNVATAAYPIGHVKSVPTEAGLALYGGFTEFVYLLFEDATAPTMVAQDWAVPGSATVWYQYTNDPDNTVAVEVGHGWAVVCLSVMTSGRYGWFWCGGPPPGDHVLGIAVGTDWQTDGNVAIGSVICDNLVADQMGLGANTSVEEAIIGWSGAADVA